MEGEREKIEGGERDWCARSASIYEGKKGWGVVIYQIRYCDGTMYYDAYQSSVYL